MLYIEIDVSFDLPPKDQFKYTMELYDNLFDELFVRGRLGM